MKELNKSSIENIANLIIESRISAIGYEKLEEIPEFPVVTLEELYNMHKRKKISLIFRFDSTVENTVLDKKTNRLLNLLLTLNGLLVISFIVYLIYYSIYYTNYFVLIGIPLTFVGIALSSPFIRVKNVVLFISVIGLGWSFLIDNETLILLLLSFSIVNILSNIIRTVQQNVMSKFFLSNEKLFVQGYINRLISIRNNKNKKILFYLEEPSLHRINAELFEVGLSV
jgi:hypothetical protein